VVFEIFMSDPLAHSPKGVVPAQTYREHVENVRRLAVANARFATATYTGNKDMFVEAVEAAAIYHDLGKLDDSNQEVLRRESREPLRVAHEDAGVAALLKSQRRESALLVAAHHAGLFSQEVEQSKQRKLFRNIKVADLVDHNLDRYVTDHAATGCPTPDWIESASIHRCGFTRRVALSCLVDADHSDTARHYGNEVRYDPPALRWRERLEALDNYVGSLPAGLTDSERLRNSLRRQLYDACRGASVDPAMRSCDAPVGTGKTTAVMAHLLQAAQKKELRHVFVVLPYTNIIKQSVDTYRRALVLPGERPEDVVAEHHHQADFGDVSLRQLAGLWRAPIIVTTAVQFFETLAGHHPARLRKLHELARSAVFVDETHAAIPSHLWPQVWLWLETWTRDWRGHIVLASGSLPRFWELGDFVVPPKKPEDVPDLVSPALRGQLEDAEKVRIRPQRKREPLDCKTLIEQVSNQKGPRLVILNTVQSAAVIASRMRESGQSVLHLSTALAPVHRERIVEKIKERLKNKDEGNWTLVATSCVEAGMDFSFRVGFRESCSTASLIQISGRVSRGGEHSDAAVWDFRILDSLLSQHPAFTVSRRVLDSLFDNKLISMQSPSQLAKEAMRLEITEGGKENAQRIRDQENGMEYPDVSRLCQVIQSDTRTVVIDNELVTALRGKQRVSHRDLLLNSVQIWSSKVVKLPIAPLFPNRMKDADQNTLYVWDAQYDPEFLGYMAGVLPILDGLKDGCFLA